MAITLVDGLVDTDFTTSGDTLNFTLTNTQADDIVIIAAAKEEFAASSAYSTPSGFTQKFNQDVSGANAGQFGLWYQRLSGADNSHSISLASTPDTLQLAGVCAAFRGCLASGDPFEDSASPGEDTNLTTAEVVLGSFQPAAADNCILAIAGGPSSVNASSISSPFTNFQYVEAQGPGQDAQVMFGIDIQTTSTSRSPIFTLAATQNRNTLFYLGSLKPAVAAGGIEVLRRRVEGHA